MLKRENRTNLVPLLNIPVNGRILEHLPAPSVAALKELKILDLWRLYAVLILFCKLHHFLKLSDADCFVARKIYISPKDVYTRTYFHVHSQ